MKQNKIVLESIWTLVRSGFVPNFKDNLIWISALTTILVLNYATGRLLFNGAMYRLSVKETNQARLMIATGINPLK